MPNSSPIRNMPGRDRRDLGGNFRRRVATPDHVQVRPQQDQVVAVNVASNAVGHVEHGHRRAARADGAFERAGVNLAAAELEDGIAVADAVLYRRAVVEPDVRQPRAGPGGRLVFAEQMLRPAGDVADDGRVDIAIAELGADHLVTLALLDIGNRAEIVPRRRAGRGIVANIRPPHRAPFAAAQGSVARGADIVLADLAALDLV